MPITKRDGAGILFEKASGLNLDWLGPWVTIPGAMGTVPMPGGAAASYDATTHDDILAGQITKQKRAAISDIPDVVVTLMWDPDSVEHKALLTDMGNRTTRQYRWKPFGVTQRYYAEAQVVVGSAQADINGALTNQITLIISRTNFIATT
jgi:hypothetical protein